MKEKIPNLLTVMRGILTLLIIPLFFIDFPGQFIGIYILFVMASTSDFLDGYLARRWNCVSDFGKIFDPLFDKILTITLYVLLIPYAILPSWIFILLILRELLVDGLKNFMLAHGKVTPAILSGKLKFIFQVLFLHAALLFLIFPEIEALRISVFVLVGGALIFAYGSGFFYLRHFLAFFHNAKH